MNNQKLCKAEVEKNIILVETGGELTLPLSVLNQNCEFRKAWDKAFYVFHPDKLTDRQAYYKAYNQKPEVKAYHKAYEKAYYQKPEVKAHRKAYYQQHKNKLANEVGEK